MATKFLDNAQKLLSYAVREEEAGNLAEAIVIYKQGIGELMKEIKSYKQSSLTKDKLRLKADYYIEHVTSLKEQLKNQPPPTLVVEAVQEESVPPEPLQDGVPDLPLRTSSPTKAPPENVVPAASSSSAGMQPPSASLLTPLDTFHITSAAFGDRLYSISPSSSSSPPTSDLTSFPTPSAPTSTQFPASHQQYSTAESYQSFYAPSPPDASTFAASAYDVPVASPAPASSLFYQPYTHSSSSSSSSGTSSSTLISTQTFSSLPPASTNFPSSSSSQSNSFIPPSSVSTFNSGPPSAYSPAVPSSSSYQPLPSETTTSGTRNPFLPDAFQYALVASGRPPEAGFYAASYDSPPSLASSNPPNRSSVSASDSSRPQQFTFSSSVQPSAPSLSTTTNFWPATSSFSHQNSSSTSASNLGVTRPTVSTSLPLSGNGLYAPSTNGSESPSSPATVHMAQYVATHTSRPTPQPGPASGRCKGWLRPMVGLANLAQSCYMNAPLQCLASTGPLMEALLVRRLYLKDGRQDPSRHFLDGMVDVFVQLHNKKDNEYLFPQAVKSLVDQVDGKFQGCAQQDAMDLYEVVMNELHRCVNRVRAQGQLPTYGQARLLSAPLDSANAESSWQHAKAQDDSFVNDLFDYQLETRISCRYCNKAVSGRFEVSRYLVSLPLPAQMYQSTTQEAKQESVPLMECLRLFFFRDEVLSDYRCPVCAKKDGCRQTTFLKRMPEILALQIKRRGPNGKAGCLIQYPDTLSLQEFLSDGGGPSLSLYDLYAVVNHIDSAQQMRQAAKHGGSARAPPPASNSGHYHAYCLGAGRQDQWVWFNDSKVTPIPPEQVNQVVIRDTSTPGSSLLAGLFYQRRH